MGKKYKLEIVFSIPECDYISPEDIIEYIKEDFPDWFAANLEDGDPDRMKLLKVVCDENI